MLVQDLHKSRILHDGARYDRRGGIPFDGCGLRRRDFPGLVYILVYVYV